LIGIFDSGLGGLTAVKQIRGLMPQEDLVYFGDTGRVPYGTKSRATIIQYAKQDVAFLQSKGVDAILVACGTVSTTALSVLQKQTKIPVVGVVEPACRAAVEATKSGSIAVLGTNATIRSGAFPDLLKDMQPSLRVYEQACPLFVPLVENGVTDKDDPIARLAVERYLNRFKDTDIDTVILGCTHYPLLSQVIADLLPGVTLINTGYEAAKVLCEGRSGNGTGTARYYVSDDPEMFIAAAGRFLGQDVKGQVSYVDIGAY